MRGLNQLMWSKPSPLVNWIFNSNTYITNDNQIKQLRISSTVHHWISNYVNNYLSFYSVFKHSNDAIFIFDYLHYIGRNCKSELNTWYTIYLHNNTTTEGCNNVLFNDTKSYAYTITVCLTVGYNFIAVDMMS